VLFPGVDLPLHVFELRYLQLVRDALSGERFIAMALLQPGWERDYHGSPEFHRLGCLAHIEEAAWLPDDCYHVHLKGLTRVTLGRTVREFPYRSVRTQPLIQEPFSEDDALIQLERRALIEAGRRFAQAARAAGADPVPVDEHLTFEPLVNNLCMVLEVEPEDRLALLAMDSVLERARRARELMEAQTVRATRGDPPAGERN
jgi:Lon protease-like protein